jgi:hypothetical protein
MLLILALLECWVTPRRYLVLFVTYAVLSSCESRMSKFNCVIVLCLWLQAREGITEVHFLPFNPVEKRTAITYIDSDGNWHRVSKGAPEQVIISNPLQLLPILISLSYLLIL